MHGTNESLLASWPSDHLSKLQNKAVRLSSLACDRMQEALTPDPTLTMLVSDPTHRSGVTSRLQTVLTVQQSGAARRQPA